MTANTEEILLADSVTDEPRIKRNLDRMGDKSHRLQVKAGVLPRSSNDIQEGASAYLPKTLSSDVGLSAFDARRFVAQQARALQEFVPPLELEIANLRSKIVLEIGAQHESSNPESSNSEPSNSSFANATRLYREVAELVIKIINQVDHRETNLYSLEPQPHLLLGALSAGPIESEIVQGLISRAQGVLKHSSTAPSVAALGYGRELSRGDLKQFARFPQRRVRQSERYDLLRELDELRMFLSWYTRRKMSLAALDADDIRIDTEVGVVRSLQLPSSDTFFNIEVLHDHLLFGVKGCLVTSGLRLFGRDGQTLWYKVAVLNEGELVHARREWSTWSDLGTAQDGDSILDSTSAFCSLVPVRPNAQRIVIDEVRAFIPYAALDLPPGRNNLELNISLSDLDGTDIIATSRSVSLSVPRRDTALTPVPAPHAVEIWPHDVVSGDRISNLELSAAHKIVGGWEQYNVSISFDLALFMHAGESVLLECRFLYENGEIVELSSLGIAYLADGIEDVSEAVTPYRYRRTLHPRNAWALYNGVTIDIPVEFLQLRATEQVLTCEVVAVSHDDRVLCGDMAAVRVFNPRLGPAGHSDGEERPLSKRFTIPPKLNLRSIGIESSHEIDGNECIRVESTFALEDRARRLAAIAAGQVGEFFPPFRVEVALEREDGHVLLQAFTDSLGVSFKPVSRAVCIDSQSSDLEHTAVVTFPKLEVLSWSFQSEEMQSNTKLRLFARVSAQTVDGQILATETREFFVRPSIEKSRRGTATSQVVTDARVEPENIVDLVGELTPDGSSVEVCAYVNIQPEEAAHINSFIYTGHSGSAAPLFLEGFVKQKHDPTSEGKHVRVPVENTVPQGLNQAEALFQSKVFFTCEVPQRSPEHEDKSADLQLITRLLNAAGEVLHTMMSEVSSRGSGDTELSESDAHDEHVQKGTVGQRFVSWLKG